MNAPARPLKLRSSIHDLRKDWCRWSAAERTGAVTILVALFALFLAILITAPQT